MLYSDVCPKCAGSSVVRLFQLAVRVMRSQVLKRVRGFNSDIELRTCPNAAPYIR